MKQCAAFSFVFYRFKTIISKALMLPAFSVLLETWEAASNYLYHLNHTEMKEKS